MQKAIDEIRRFNRERDWEQYHTPQALARSISIEAGELLECFQWSDEYDRAHVLEELADVATYCVDMADALGVSLEDIILDKMEKNKAKYPVEKARGSSKKYDQL